MKSQFQVQSGTASHLTRAAFQNGFVDIHALSELNVCSVKAVIHMKMLNRQVNAICGTPDGLKVGCLQRLIRCPKQERRHQSTCFTDLFDDNSGNHNASPPTANSWCDCEIVGYTT
jgi:hypothetical protein